MSRELIPQHINLEELPQRALYSTTAAEEDEAETPQPILCDNCNGRAGAIARLLYWCPGCEVASRVSPGCGRVEYSPEQLAELFGGTGLDKTKLTEDSAASRALEPLDPSEY